MIRARHLLAAATALAAWPTVAHAQQETRLSADVVGTVGYSNNPFQSVGDDTDAAFASVDFLPRYVLLTPRSTLEVSAAASLQQYLRRYGRNDSYSGAVDYRFRPNERVSAHTRLDLASTVLGSYNSYLPGVVGIGGGPVAGVGTGVSGAAPVTVPGPDLGALPTVILPPFTDIGLFGARERRRSARLSGDVGIGLSARDSLTISAFGEAARYRRFPALSNYEAYGTTVGYSRQVSQRVNLGIQGSAALYDYRQARGDTRVYSVQGTGSAQLNQYWTLDGALGVSFVDGSAIGSTTSTSISGNANLCRRGERSTMCILASRQVSPTGIAGSQYVTTAGLSWTKQLDERENLSLSAFYSKVGGRDRILLPGTRGFQNEYVQVVAGYDRQLAERLRFVASANYRQLFGNNAGRPKDFGGQLGLTYRLGDLR